MFTIDFNKKTMNCEGVVKEKEDSYTFEVFLRLGKEVRVKSSFKKRIYPGDKVTVEFSAFDYDLLNGKIIEVFK